IGLAWFVNLYNFMDGIDGIAGSQAAIFCLGALYFGAGGPFDATFWVVLASCAGFLCLNWAPARVIMGDTGSGFLGFTIGALAVYLWQTGALPLLTSLILLAAFWFDATYTLAVRFVTRQRVAEAHSNHLYQKLARRWGHGRTTALLWGYAAVWLAPLAVLYGRLDPGVLWLVLACLPILAACVVFRAGLPDDTAHA
ncbi:MAG: glycosyl transferase, partial [Gammaproteobacteria bacterium]|nr:glycosyl transferase [Gammaproteobacteria bacterium]